MKDISGYTRKTIWIFSVLLFVLFCSPTKTFAQTTLTTDSTFSHNIKEGGLIETTLTFTISAPQKTVLTYYTITIPQKDIEPEIYSLSRNRKLEATKYHRTNSTDLLIDFENTVIEGDGNTKIRISYIQKYDDKKIINLISSVIDTPTSTVSIIYPKEWGETSWVSDQIEDIKINDSSYILSIANPDSDTVKIIFGENIIYSFNISRSFNNPTDTSNQYEVIIPQDNQFQKIIIEDINIQPTQAFLDGNSNYILIYTLQPQSQIDLKISGYVIMGNHEYYGDINSTYDSKDIYWSLEDKQMEKVEKYLTEKGITKDSEKALYLKYLYSYVIEELQPSISATTLAGGVRRGAIETLKSTSESTPEDYADLLRTLLSYYEIPAIYSIGYVSDISSYQPNGMFHYWVQAFDGKNWFVLDPYLEDFSKVSLYGREQLDHISILNRVTDSISPILTYYSDNDIKFEYAKDSQIEYRPDSNSSISLEPYSILNKYLYARISIENTGNTIFTTITLQDSKPDLSEYVDSVTNSVHSILLPHMNKDIDLHIPFNTLDDDIILSTINIKNGTQSVSSELVSTEYSISKSTDYDVLIKFISILLFLITFGILYILIDKFMYKK